MITSLLLILAVLLGLHLPVFLFLWARCRQARAFDQLTLGACLGACAQVVLTTYALSLVRWLTPPLCLAMNIVVSCLWIAVAWRAGLAWGELRGAIRERAALARQLPRRPAVCAVLLLSAVGVTWLLAKAWIYPIYDWDGAQAHFAVAREMLQERGAPTQFAPIPRITCATFVPHIFYAATLSLPHGYEWVNGTNIYFLLLAAFAQYCFVRRLGLRRSTALLVSPAVLFCPVLFQQATSGYIDLTAVAFVGAILPFLPSRRESAVVEFTFAAYGNPLSPSDLKVGPIHLRGVGDTGVATYGALYGHPVSDAYKWGPPLRQLWMSWREEMIR